MSPLQKPAFRNAQGVRFTKALFFETTLADKSSVVYTLKDQDHEGFRSLYRLYIETKDPTEYRFATQYLDGWEHWTMLCECPWFRPYVARWREELYLLIASESLARIMAEAKTSSKESFTANRYLLERGWEPKESSKRGRPTKAAIKQEASRIASEGQQIDSDFNRILSPLRPN